MEHEIKLQYKLPALPEPEPNTYTPEAFRALVERMRALLTKRKRKDMNSTRDFDVTPGVRQATGISSNNTYISIESNLDGFDYSYYHKDIGCDYMLIRVMLHSTYIASALVTPTDLKFYNDGWCSMTTARRMRDCRRWFDRLFGGAHTPFLDNSITVSKPVTKNQYEHLRNLAAPETYVIGGKKWYRVDSDRRDDLIEAALTRSTRNTAVMVEDTPPNGAQATAARRVWLLHNTGWVDMDDSDKPVALRIASDEVPNPLAILLAAQTSGITVEDNDIVIPRSAWESRQVWDAIPEEIMELLPGYKVEQLAFGHAVYRGSFRYEQLSRRTLINAAKYQDRNEARVEIAFA